MKQRILIVDDDASVRDSLKKLLQESGYEVLAAADCEEAERKASSEPLDLMLIDLDSPNQTGWNVFGLIRASNPLFPIIVITSSTDRSEAMVPGIAAFFEKPIDVPTLLITVERFLGQPAENPLRSITGRLEAA